MTDNVRKIFDILGVEPNEKFKIKGDEKIYYCDETLSTYGVDGVKYVGMLAMILTEEIKIIKLPKEPKKKKLRDLTKEEYNEWLNENCGNCNKCVFYKVSCNSSYVNSSWINNKDLYSDKFLDQEIEVEE